MKATLTLVACLALSACSSSPKFDDDKHDFKQRLTQAQMEIGRLQTIGFCGDDPRLKSYMETDYFWSFTCYDGRSFLLYKEQ